MNLKQILTAGVSAGILLSTAYGCVNVDTSLGQDLMPLEQQYDVYTAEWDIEDIALKKMDYMSGYSSRRITIGAIREDGFGLTRKGSAFTLVPILDTLDLGTDPEYKEFHVSFKKDTTNAASLDQLSILQNVNVYSVKDSGKEINDLAYMDELNNGMFAGKTRITEGVPVYNGGDSLSFKFSRSFGKKMLETLSENAVDGVFVFDTISNYIQKFPGIYMCTDDPLGNGGRFDMFDVVVGTEDSYVTGNYAELKIRSTYDGEKKDTSFLFIYGAVATADGTTLPDQYAFNVTEVDGGCADQEKAGAELFVEGGNGVKPVVSAKEIWEKTRNEILSRCSEDVLDQVIINKASISLPFVFPGDYNYMEAFPIILSPCSKVKSTTTKEGVEKTSYTYANLTDAGISAEKHGEIDRSNLIYNADCSFHAQKMLTLESDAEFSNYDIWFLIHFNEINETSSSSSSSSYSDYLNQMYYYNYLNQLYGGYGYSGYGYSNYSGYGYNNYYSMMMMSSLYSSSSSSQTSTSEELDRDRFYGAKLCGPESTGRKPKYSITYSVPKKAIE